MKREKGVGARDAGNEVVFEGSNGSFGSVASMNARWDKLQVNVLLVNELLEGFGSFVVDPSEFGSQACGNENSQGLLVGGNMRCSSFVLHGLGMDEVRIIVVEDEELGVALAAG